MNKKTNGQTELIMAIAVVLIVSSILVLTQLGTNSPTGAAIDPVTLNPTDDGYIEFNGYYYELWLEDKLSVYNYEENGYPTEFRSFLKFNLAGQTNISSAILYLDFSGGGSTANCPKLYKIADYGVLQANSTDFNPTTPAPLLISVLPCFGDATIDVTNYIQENAINAFMIKGDYITGITNYGSSRVYKSPPNKPKIVLNFAESPSTPSTPTATAGDGQVDLTWTAITGATYYKIGWNTNGSTSSYTIINNITNTSYTHTGRTNGTTYYYAIQACNSTVCSNWSSPNTSA
ncbi:MAG: hypothetical protein COT90_04410, partial [Candidatus Diapherotrites archaeon CG10_big_fil_rev_8_21_14_0_10_31_34]